MSKVNRRHAIIVLLVVALLTALTTTFIFVNETIAEVQEIPMNLEVADTAAFNLDTDALHFGRVTTGDVGIRTVNITNTLSEPVIAEFRITGELEAWAAIDDNNVPLYPGAAKKLNVTVSVPEDAEFGKYKGKLIVIFKKI
jgi:hypothetical protein